MPMRWRRKFDKMSYIVAAFDRTMFLSKCEAIERNAPKNIVKTIPKRASNRTRKFGTGNDNERQFVYCRLHGTKSRHNTEDCRILQRDRQQNSKHSEKESRFVPVACKTAAGFSSKQFGKEISSLSKKTNKKQALDNFSAVIKSERRKLAAKDKSVNFARKSQRKEDHSSSSSESDSDSDKSHNYVDFKQHKKDVENLVRQVFSKRDAN